MRESAKKVPGLPLHSYFAMILQTLREHTHESHRRLEGRLDLLERTISLGLYRDLLARFYGFYVPAEARLARLCFAMPALQDAQRRKEPLLVQDLKALGMSAGQIQSLPLCADLPALAMLPQALGCLYVLEGSTLGGQIISRHLQSVHDLDAGNGAAFFRSYGPEVGAMWRAFGAALCSYPAGPEEEKLILSAACETFSTLEAWLCDE